MRERRYDDAEAAARLKDLPGWSAREGWLVRTWDTDGWPTTLMLVNAIGFLAEAADHHPDLEVSWGRVTARLQTHTAGGVTDKDLELAAELERLATWRPTGGALAGTTRAWVGGIR